MSPRRPPPRLPSPVVETSVLTASDVARALGLRPRATFGEPGRFSFVTADSREVRAGALYVALVGPSRDGHAFVDEAIRAGAAGVVYARDHQLGLPPTTLGFPAEDTLAAYRSLAGAWRRQFSVPVVAVAGSVGKTTTKAFIASFLRAAGWDVVVTEGSRNGFTGVPETLLRLRSHHRAAVVEVGIDRPGAMAKHMALVAPTVSIVTAIGPEHLEGLGDLATVLREECLALDAATRNDGTSVLNLDDPSLRTYRPQLRTGRRISYTLSQARGDASTLRGAFDMHSGTLAIGGLGLPPLRLSPPLPGEHNARNFLGAVAVARWIGVPTEAIEAGGDHVRLPPNRSSVRALGGGVQVICDWSNANPTSMTAALRLLHGILPADRERGGWACLGDMLELGEQSAALHAALARELAVSNLAHVCTIGPRMEAVSARLSAQGWGPRARHFATHEELAATLLAELSEGDVVLIKGSAATRMGRVWELLSGRWDVSR